MKQQPGLIGDNALLPETPKSLALLIPTPTLFIALYAKQFLPRFDRIMHHGLTSVNKQCK
jgi:hypothetical protein